MYEDDERPHESLLGCLGRFLFMSVLTWMFLLGTALLIYTRWCQH